MMSATAAPGRLTRAAGMRSRPVSKAMVTITLRACVSVQPALDQTVRDPAADRLARAEHEIRQRRVDARTSMVKPRAVTR